MSVSVNDNAGPFRLISLDRDSPEMIERGGNRDLLNRITHALLMALPERIDVDANTFIGSSAQTIPMRSPRETIRLKCRRPFLSTRKRCSRKSSLCLSVGTSLASCSTCNSAEGFKSARI